uniref:FANCL UBC-like domain-containing protein n=1 Tax=Palpitomonas bilix TaxID=652834 RepID=A0A7S3DK26_9EUKA|mmetsp:Transcript_41115/g.106242  ORF Transcript_41115/g.106242 Transcript_41115/m.106242 type:complete len:314 (+) Transcript_41115:159-1100(+)
MEDSLLQDRLVLFNADGKSTGFLSSGQGIPVGHFCRDDSTGEVQLSTMLDSASRIMGINIYESMKSSFPSVLARDVADAQATLWRQADDELDLLLSLAEEVALLGWDCVKTLDNNNRITLAMKDEGQRTHTTTISLRSGNENEISFVWDLPGDGGHLRAKRGWLRDHYNHFQSLCLKLQNYFSVLDEIDNKCWVLEPEKPSYAVPRRRILLKKFVSLEVELDPTSSQYLKKWKFYGSDRETQQLEEKLGQGIASGKWQKHETPFANLCNLLNLVPPAKKDLKEEDVDIFCGICYSAKVSGPSSAGRRLTIGEG